jgi:hypothetical protein
MLGQGGRPYGLEHHASLLQTAIKYMTHESGFLIYVVTVGNKSIRYKSAAIFCQQVAALVLDMLCNYYFVKKSQN